MPLRIVTAFGPPFGGFRVAFRAGVFGLDWPAGFEVLERAARHELNVLASLSPDRRARLQADPLPPHPGPELGQRVGAVDGVIVPEDTGSTLVVMCASFPFRFWPFGRWAVFAAGRIAEDGRLDLLSDDELQRYW